MENGVPTPFSEVTVIRTSADESATHEGEDAGCAKRRASKRKTHNNVLTNLQIRNDGL
jgi:hypothetical protein